MIKAARIPAAARAAQTTTTRSQLITGRTLYHFHTRTKTGRAPQLQAAAPEVWVEMSAGRRGRLGIGRGRPASRSRLRAGRLGRRLRISGIRRGVLFLPFHYGYWDTDGGTARRRTAGRPTS